MSQCVCVCVCVCARACALVCACMYCYGVGLSHARLEFGALPQLNQYSVLHLDRICAFCINELKLNNTTFRFYATYIRT